ncbi:MAG: cysteine--tRNA ligase [Pseudomonadales bacterium]
MLQVFNTLTQKKEVFEPLQAGKVRMYVCGITVYDYCHLGHARMLLAFDVIARWLRHRGFELTYVRNITDIDDKILRRAGELNEEFSALTARFIQELHDDERKLGIAEPDVEPRATQYIGQIIAMTQTLIDKGYAYAAENGDVYYAVTAFDDYGKLSHKKIDELLSGARVEVGELKKDPRDFALWKGAKPEEQARWDSPWGTGRPGWHIECSAMATENLGDSFDIHGGGTDLIFPHHENEIAQAEAATGCHFASYWLHNGAVRVDKVKMSKSLGNFFTIREVLDKYPAEVVRYFLVSSHYRSAINYSDANLQNARAALDRIYLALRGVPHEVAVEKYENDYTQRFTAAMDDDFNTPEALAVLFDMAKAINTCKGHDSDKAGALASQLRHLARPLGILQLDAEEFLKTPAFSVRSSADQSSDELRQEETDEEIEALVQQREDAKKAKDYPKADQIRDALEALGVVLEDSRDGTSWRRKH